MGIGNRRKTLRSSVGSFIAVPSNEVLSGNTMFTAIHESTKSLMCITLGELHSLYIYIVPRHSSQNHQTQQSNSSKQSTTQSTMGLMSVTASSVFPYPRETVYDFATDPNNWGGNYKNSAGMLDPEHVRKNVPLPVGFEWSEIGQFSSNTYLSTWTLSIAERPFKFEFHQVNNQMRLKSDGSGGVPGITTITYTFEEAGDGGSSTLFRRTLKCELPKGAELPDDVFLAMAKPSGIDQYHDALRQKMADSRS